MNGENMVFDLTENDRDVLIRYMAKASVCAEGEEDLVYAAAKLFSENFEDTTVHDGVKAARSLLVTVEKFESEKSRVLSTDVSLRETLTGCLDGAESDEERKEILRAMTDSVKTEDFARLTGDVRSDEELDALCEASRIFADSFDLHPTEASHNGGGIKHNKTEMKVLHAMALYCAAKKDELSKVPNTVMAQQCAIAVCAGCELNSFSAEDGENERNSLKSRLFILMQFMTADFFVKNSAPKAYIIGSTLLFAFCIAAIGFCRSLLKNAEFVKALLTPVKNTENAKPSVGETVTQVTAERINEDDDETAEENV